MANGEQLGLSPDSIVRAVDQLLEVNETVTNRQIDLANGTTITVDGGAVHTRGSSWTERDYKVKVPSDEGEVEISVGADPSDPYGWVSLKLIRGKESWDFLSDDELPEWAVAAAGVLGVAPFKRLQTSNS